MGYFDIDTPPRRGFMALELDAVTPKKGRGNLLSTAAVKTDETTVGLQDFGARQYSEPGNALFWKHTGVAPRGAWGSWSFAFPARHLGGNRYRPLALPGQEDPDFCEETVVTAQGWASNPPVGSEAIILATTEHGNHQKIAFTIGGGSSAGPLIAQHLGNKPPQYSTHVADISGDQPDPDRHAGLDTAWQVRKWVAPCSGASSADVEDEYAIAIVGDGSPEGKGYIFTTFGHEDALFSYMASGPLRPSHFQKHFLVRHTGDAPMIAGGISTNAYFVGSRHPFSAPLHFEEDIYPEVQNGFTPYEVHRRYDPKMDHPFLCGAREGKWREYVKLPIGETPPCTSTKDHTTSSRSYAESTRIYTDRKMLSQGIYFQPRAQITRGPMPDEVVLRRSA